MNHFFKDVGKYFWLTTFSAVMLISRLCYGHDWPVHMAITGSAYQLSSGLQTFFNENVETNKLTASPPQYSDTTTASNWLTMGSKMEDEQKYGILSPLTFLLAPVGLGDLSDERCVDHFYTVMPERAPGQVIGLTDWSEPPVVGHWVATSTTNSFKWATDGTVQRPYGIGTNIFKWDNARQYEFAALTSTNQFARNTNMAMTFYALGHILHLNQDLTSPDHARNDDHVIKAYIENYGLDNYTNNPQWFVPTNNPTIGWANWQAQGFSQLLDFWDTSNYVHSSSFNLGEEAAGRVKLGLAEWSNGNFLGERALYTECYKPGDKHYFPYPRKSSTDFPGHFQSITIRQNGRNLPTIMTNNVVTKTRDGVTGFRHSILSYLGTKFPNVPTTHNTTINDDGVLQDYHNILIPKAVEYSAGLLDYFFRGTMDVSIIGYDTNSLQYTNLIVNTSGQDFSGGAFFIYQDDTNSIRTLFAQTNFLNQTLLDGDSMTMTFPSSTPQSTNLVLVYQGTIVPTDGSPSDPVDANIGIAAQKFMPWLEQTTTTNYWVPLESLGLQPGATITGILESDEFPFAPTPGNYEVIINSAYFDDKGTIGDIPSTGPSVACTIGQGGYGWGNEIDNTAVPSNKVTVVGNRLQVNITATDDPNCGGWIGWVDVSITWRAWPAP